MGWVGILFSESIKSLDVISTPTLNWNGKNTAVCNKIKLNRHLLTIDLRIKLISTLILPYLHYCCLLMLDMPRYVNLGLQRALNSAVCFIYDFSFRGFKEYITAYFAKLNWLKIDKKREYHLGIFLCKPFNYGHLSPFQRSFLHVGCGTYLINVRSEHSLRIELTPLVLLLPWLGLDSGYFYYRVIRLYQN